MIYTDYLKTRKWSDIAKKRMEIDGNRCVMCGSTGTSNNPLEVHHLTYNSLYHEEDRIYEDLMTVCRCCHKGLHRAMERVTSPDGRRGWKENPRIPKIHAYNISGEVQFEIEEEDDEK